MSVGKTVITTTVGAQGINCTDGRDVLIANTPQEFAAQVKRCLDDPEFCQSIGREARRLIAEQYDVRKLTDRLIDFYNQRLEK
jgi:glycosyltransferase involved in cell wall biosynthesis